MGVKGITEGEAVGRNLCSEFDSVGEVEWALNFGQRSFKGVVLHLVNWNRSIGCSTGLDRPPIANFYQPPN